MPTTPFPIRKVILAAGDVLVFCAALAIALFVRHGGVPEPTIVQLYTFAAPFLIALWLAGFFAFGLYDLEAAKNELRFFERLARAVACNFAITVILFYLIPEFGLRPLVTLAIIFAATAALALAWRTTYNTALARRTRERILFFGITDEVTELAKFLSNNPQLGFVPAVFMRNGVSDGPLPPDLCGPVLDFNKNLPDTVREFGIDRIVIAHTIAQTRRLVRALFEVVPLKVVITNFPRFYESVEGKVPVLLISETWFLENLVGSRRPRYEFAKRIADLTLAFILGAVALALLPCIALAIVLSTPRDVLNYKKRRARDGNGIIFFRQQRIGRNGTRFDFLKFRGQVLGAERFGGEKDMAYDPRAYPFGNFLRKTYLDELPQLWNVIRGDMSFVGPRPERPEFVAELEQTVPFYRMRELVLPGITGWAQINMENNASVSDAPEKIQYDLYYIKNRSLLFDLMVMAKTAFKLLQRSGR